MTKFSIGIPAFKGKFLKECIDSILHQTYGNFELIIINDCSPEPVNEIVNKYTDDRIKYFENSENVGAENVVDNWNKCLDKAAGDFFLLMGDDDKLEPTYFQEFINLINDYPDLDVYHCRSKIINEDSIPYSITPINPSFEDIYDFILSCIRYHRQQYISDFIYRTSALKANNGFYKFPLAWESDYVSAWIACGQKGIAHTNKTIFNYRANQYSISSTNDIKSIILKAKATLQCEEWIYNFIERLPLGIDNALKHAAIKMVLKEHRKTSRSNTLKQVMRQVNAYTLIDIIELKRQLSISYKEIVLVFLSSFFSKLRDE